MAYQARTDKFGRAYAAYKPDPDVGPVTEVLPAVQKGNYLRVINGKVHYPNR